MRKIYTTIFIVLALVACVFSLSACNDNYKDYLYLKSNGVVEYEYTEKYDNGEQDNMRSILTVKDKKATDEIYVYDNSANEWKYQVTLYYFLLDNGDYLVVYPNVFITNDVDVSMYDSRFAYTIKSAYFFENDWKLNNFKVNSISKQIKTPEIPSEVNYIYLSNCQPIELSDDIFNDLLSGQGSGRIVMQGENAGIKGIIALSIKNKHLIFDLDEFTEENVNDFFPKYKKAQNRSYYDSDTVYYLNLENDSYLTVYKSNGEWQYDQAAKTDWQKMKSDLNELLTTNNFKILEYTKDITLDIPEEVLKVYNDYINNEETTFNLTADTDFEAIESDMVSEEDLILSYFRDFYETILLKDPRGGSGITPLLDIRSNNTFEYIYNDNYPVITKRDYDKIEQIEENTETNGGYRNQYFYDVSNGFIEYDEDGKKILEYTAEEIRNAHEQFNEFFDNALYPSIESIIYNGDEKSYQFHSTMGQTFLIKIKDDRVIYLKTVSDEKPDEISIVKLYDIGTTTVELPDSINK